MTSNSIAQARSHVWGILLLAVSCGGRRFESESHSLSSSAGRVNTTQPSASPSADGGTASLATATSLANSQDLTSPTIDAGGTLPDADTLYDAFPPDTSSGGPTEDFANDTPSDASGQSIDEGSLTDSGFATTERETTRPDPTHSATNDISSGVSNPDGTDDDSTTSDQTSDISEPMETHEPRPPCAPDERTHAGTCYFVGDAKKDWHSARQSCQGRGQTWDIAAINSPDEHAWVSTQLTDDTWIGGSVANDTWVWANTGVAFWHGDFSGHAADGAFTLWEGTEPDARGDAEQCLRYSNDSEQWAWADMPCTREYHFVCEQAP